MTCPIEKFVLFERGTGRVVSTGMTQLLERMVTTDLDVLAGIQATPNKAYVQGGVVVAIPEQPSEFHVFDWRRKCWVADFDAAWASVKQQRARLLAGSDWMVTKAAESGQAVPPDWMAYRQALRDITLQADPWAIVWPVAP